MQFIYIIYIMQFIACMIWTQSSPKFYLCWQNKETYTFLSILDSMLSSSCWDSSEILKYSKIIFIICVVEAEETQYE